MTASRLRASSWPSTNTHTHWRPTVVTGGYAPSFLALAPAANSHWFVHTRGLVCLSNFLVAVFVFSFEVHGRPLPPGWRHLTSHRSSLDTLSPELSGRSTVRSIQPACLVPCNRDPSESRRSVIYRLIPTCSDLPAEPRTPGRFTTKEEGKRFLFARTRSQNFSTNFCRPARRRPHVTSHRSRRVDAWWRRKTVAHRRKLK